MLTVDDALEAVLERAAPLPPCRLPLRAALGCVLAEEVVADGDLPPFDKALVDGYAVRAADVAGPGTTLRIGEELPAGRTPSRPLARGEAALIMTGAP
ncbi:MAG TPA: molybdopterin molybdenumtransferase MoeA, partial [Isosphaeraceae bacterium]